MKLIDATISNSRKKFKHKLAGLPFVIAILFTLSSAFAQNREAQNLQFWFDYIPNYPMGKWAFDCEIGPRVVVGAESWSELSASPNWEYSPNNWVDFAMGLSMSYTHQADDFDSFEMRPYVGIRPYFYTKHGFKGIKLIDFFRFEYRAQYTFGTKERSNSTRFRNRIQAIIPLNRRAVFEHKSWHAIADLEFFYNAGNLKERFSTRQRVRVGLGYKHSNAWRYQAIYCLQGSRDTIDEPFSTTDSIFRFRAIHFF